MKEIIEAITKENLNRIIAAEGVEVKLVYSNKEGLLSDLMNYIPNLKNPDEKEEAIVALGCVAKNQNRDCSAFIFDILLKEKNAGVVESVLCRMKGLKIPVKGQMENIKRMLSNNKKKIREGARAILGVCYEERTVAEDLLINLLEASSKEEDIFSIANILMEIGTKKCIPAMISAAKRSKGLDGLAMILLTIKKIDPISSIDFFIYVLQNISETYCHRIAMSCLAMSKDKKALPVVLEKTQKILSVKPKNKNIAYQGENSELVEALIYLQHFRNEPDVTELLNKIKNEKKEFMDLPTQDWVHKNL